MRISATFPFMKVVIFEVILSSLLFLSLSCIPKKEGKNISLFQKVPSKRTNITFKNSLTETDTFNYFLYSYIYMGGGVSVGDFDNDALTDIYFTGNMESNRLYLNKGDLKFEDVTEISNTGGDKRWMLGSTICDINSDGLLDIYISVSGLSDTPNDLFLSELEMVILRQPDSGSPMDELIDSLKALKSRYPASDTLILIPDKEVLYNEIVQTMDSARDCETERLFPNIVLSGSLG